jgi:hypothetical protein
MWLEYDGSDVMDKLEVANLPHVVARHHYSPRVDGRMDQTVSVDANEASERCGAIRMS